MTEIELDNTAVSNYPREALRIYAYISIFFIGIVSVLGTIMGVFLGATLEFAMILSFGTTTTWSLSFVIFTRSMEILPEYITLTSEDIISKRKKKEISFSYENIMNIAAYERDKIGKPDNRWFVRWKKGFVTKIIYITEENAKILVKKLDEKGIEYSWNEPR